MGACLGTNIDAHAADEAPQEQESYLSSLACSLAPSLVEKHFVQTAVQALARPPRRAYGRDALGPSLAMEMDVTFLHGDTMLVNSIPPFRPPRAVSPPLSLCRTLSSFVFSFHLWVPHAVSLPERPLRIFLFGLLYSPNFGQH